MAITQNTYTGNGSTVLYSFTFPYLETTDIKVSLNGVDTTAYILANATTVQFNSAPANGAAIRIYRQTDDAGTKATFFPGSAIRSQDLNDNFLQVLYKSQETETFAASTDASAIQATANTALANSNTAITTANAASATANGIASTANTALSNSAAAVSTANAALPKSGGTMTGNITFNGTQTFPNSGLQQATTGQQGIVQLTDSTSSTSTTTAATPSSVKSAFDLANAALPLTGGTLTGNLIVPSLNGGPLAGTRNRIINGDMRIDQRNAGASVTINSAAGTYTVDRWFGLGVSSAGVYTINRSTIAPTGFTNSLAATCTTADTSIATTERYFINQTIEGLNSADLGFGASEAQTVTLSFWVQSSLSGTYCAALVNTDGSRSYVAEYSVNSANTWEYKTITIPGDTTGTWNTDNTIGISVRFALAIGSNFQTAAGAWNAGNFNATSNQVNWMSSSSSRTFRITGVQLEPGSVATPFERRSYGQELALCQRYYYSYGVEMRYAARNNGANRVLTYAYPVLMRALPTITYGTNTGFTPTVGPSTVSQAATGHQAEATAPLATDQGGIASMTASAEL